MEEKAAVKDELVDTVEGRDDFEFANEGCTMESRRFKTGWLLREID